MRRVFIFLLALALACGPALRSPAANARLVQDVGAYVTAQHWQNSPWYRPDDDTSLLPVFLVIAHTGEACIVPGATRAITLRNDVFACPGRWRAPRPT